MPSLGERLKYAWSAFTKADNLYSRDIGPGTYYNPDRPRMTRGSEQSILNGIITRLSIDCSSVLIQHVQLDENGSYDEVIDDGLNKIFNLEANIDQTGREFVRSAISIMLDKGHVVLVPTKTDVDPTRTSSYEIKEMRAGTVTEWYPKYVKVDLYNDDTGRHQEIIMPKRAVSITYNPFYSVMNEQNSMFQRLKRKLTLLDAIDEQSGSGKLDLIIQLPYSIKSEGRRLQAENRRTDIEKQLSNSKYGIAYIDSTEHVTQLNRAVENNLMKQIEYLTSIVYSQLGLTQEIIDGTANEQTMLNYNNRTIEPIISAFVDGIKRTFLTKNARSRGESVIFYRDPFKLMPAAQLAELADKLTRNEILAPNEIRKIIGYKPSDDPRANELRNRNINQEKQDPDAPVAPDESMQHSGIIGMHWGERNGPPYPIHKTSLARFKSPEEFSSYIQKNISYADYSGLKSPEQVLSDKKGDCHSQSLLELDELKKQGLDPKACFFIEYDPKTNHGGQTHTFVYYKKDDNYYWIENAWESQKGIHKYPSIKDLFEDVKREHFKEQSYDRKHFSGFEQTEFDPDEHAFGESLQDLVDKCLK